VRALVTGSGGQLGQALRLGAPPEVTVRAVTHAELDIADDVAVRSLVREVRPTIVINSAAYTRVDDAETDPTGAERVNAVGPAILARACREAGAWLLHVSTDYVFDGEQNNPYSSTATPRPLSVYGKTKLAGEVAVRRELPTHSILARTSWLYSAGHRNFLTRMLQRMKDGEEIRVVCDQIGVPTSAYGLTQALWFLSLRRASGIYHWCDSGVASWYDFAVAIAEEGVEFGVLSRVPSIVPVSSSEYSVVAPRPRYSVLDKRDTEGLLGYRAPHWRVSLRETLHSLALRPALRRTS